MDYLDDNDSPVVSIAIDDDETKNVLEVSVAQDADVQRVVVGPAVGNVMDYTILNDSLAEPQLGETGYLLAQCYINGQRSLCALTQDGQNVIQGTFEKIPDNPNVSALRVFQSNIPVPANSTLKFNSGMATGQIATLPKLLVEPTSFNNDFGMLILHAPDDSGVDGFIIMILNDNSSQVYWGDQVEKLYI